MAKVVKLSIRQPSEHHHYEVELVEIRAEERAEPLAENIRGVLSSQRLYNDNLDNSGFPIEEHYRAWRKSYEGLDWYFRGDPIETKGKFPAELEVQECDRYAKELKIWLNEWLQDPAFRKISDRLRMELSKEDDIRFLINAEGEVLRNLPWADWDFFQYYDKAEVALTHSEFRGHDRPVASKPKKKPGILAICGDKAGYKYNRENLDRLRSVGAEPEFLNEPDSKQVRDRLWDKNLDVLFFAGRRGDRLYLNGREKTKLSHLDNALGAAADNGLKLAIFNSADGLELAELAIDKHQIPVVIAMQEPVPNEFAQEFFEYFLLEYAWKKQSLYVAFRKARKRVSDDWQARLPGIQWLPTLWQNPAYRPPLWQDLREAVSLQQVSLAGVACTALVMLARLAGLLQPLELAVFDQAIQRRPAAEPDDRLLVVEVTEKDIQLQKEFPISDETILNLLRVLRRHKPLAIGLDLQRNAPVEPGSAELKKYLSQSDREGQSEKQSLFVSCQVGSPNRANSGSPPPADISEKQIGFRDFLEDSDGIVRRHLFSTSANSDSPCPTSYSLSTKLALRYLEAKNYRLQETSAELQLGKATLPRLKNYSGFYQQLDDDRGQQLLLNYRNFGKVADEVSLTEVLNNNIRPDKIEDKIVLVGMTAPTAGDTLATPYGAGRDRQMPGVLLQAQMTSQIISAAQGDRPLLGFWPFWADLLWVAAWSAAGGLIVVYCREPLSQRLAATAAVVSLSGICFAVFATSGIYLPLVPSALALVGTAATGLFLSSNRSAIERWLPKGLQLPAINPQTGRITFKQGA